MTACANNEDLGHGGFSSLCVVFVVVIDSKAPGGEYLSVDYQYKYQCYD